MKYIEAKSKSLKKIIIGLLIGLIGIITTVISFLKMLYFNFNDGSHFGNTIGKLFQDFVYFIYENTKFLNFFWENCPTPNIFQENIFSNINNLYFLICYLLIFVGTATYNSGKNFICV